MREEEIFRPPQIQEPSPEQPAPEELAQDEARILKLLSDAVKGDYKIETGEDGSLTVKDKETGEIVFFDDTGRIKEALEREAESIAQAERLRKDTPETKWH